MWSLKNLTTQVDMFIHSLSIHLPNGIWGSTMCQIQEYEGKRGPIPVPKEHRASHGEKTTLVHKAHAQRRTGGQENSGEAGGDGGGGGFL